MTLTDAIVTMAVGVAASIVGGAIGGVIIGGKHMGNELAAMMGGFFGPLAGAGGVVAGLIVLAVI